MNTTRELATWIATVALDDAGDGAVDRALACARHAVLDWLGVTLAGSREPVSEILLEDALANGETGDASIVGRSERVSPATSALLNGTASHALDYDDINKRMRGHPTVTILPAIVAAAEQRNDPGQDLLQALVVGNEAACVVGTLLGADHYARGFHTTATAGAVGAAAGVARLLKLDPEQTAAAIGLAATQAAGLRTLFGTMAKPLHAGKAAMNGLLAARWAAAGLGARADVLEAERGFIQAFTAAPGEARIPPGRPQSFAIEENIYKFHAACFYTHSAIDTLRSMMAQDRIDTPGIAGIDVHLAPDLLDVCDIREPATGLEIKFSVRHLLAMALGGMDTGDISLYNAETAADPGLIALRDVVRVSPEVFESRTRARVRVRLDDGSVLEESHDAGIPQPDLQIQQERLASKFLALAEPIVGETRAMSVVDAVSRLDRLQVRDLLITVCAE